MPQMGPLPWVFLFFSVLCLVFGILVLLYFTNIDYKTTNNYKKEVEPYLWMW